MTLQKALFTLLEEKARLRSSARPILTITPAWQKYRQRPEREPVFSFPSGTSFSLLRLTEDRKKREF
jgi:hypothetical protein